MVALQEWSENVWKSDSQSSVGLRCIGSSFFLNLELETNTT